MTHQIEAGSKTRSRERRPIPELRDIFTERRLTIIQGIIEDQTIQEIATGLGRSIKTVKSNIDEIRGRFGLELEDPCDDGLMKAIVYALENGLIPTDNFYRDLNRPLTERERKVLDLARLGYSTDHIARELSIVPNTAKRNLENIFPKFGVHSRYAAVAVIIALERKNL